ncbi:MULTISPECIES: hypothetical protein [Pseudomonadota]
MIQLFTIIAWFCILIGIVLGIAQTLITLATYILGLGITLLLGAVLWSRA